MKPSPFERMKVKLAAQVLSHTVAAALETLRQIGIISAEADLTIKFIRLMDSLFDVMNARSQFSPKVLNRLFTKTDNQMEVLQNAKHFFGNLIIKDHANKSVTGQMKFVYGWIVTINAFLDLFEELKCKSIPTRRLNQDCLENFNGKIRQQ